MHLTNYAINKKSKNFEKTDDDNASKRTIASVMNEIEEMFGVERSVIWNDIKDIINKTIITVQPELSHIYRACQSNDPLGWMCFQILGFDILLDKNLKPWLIEVNSSPSYNMDAAIDRNVKMNLIKDTFQILKANFTPKSRVLAMEKLETKWWELWKRLQVLKSKDLVGKSPKEKKEIITETNEKE